MNGNDMDESGRSLFEILERNLPGEKQKTAKMFK
jgi:hypothetical protein